MLFFLVQASPFRRPYFILLVYFMLLWRKYTLVLRWRELVARA
ncbi:hypothetical protein [Pontibacter chinhatensis]|nr:hypothetical protein [Pontibacter chinhatensis]